MPIFETYLACVACDATGGPTGAVGLQMLLCGAVSGVLLLKLAAQDAVRTLLRRPRDFDDLEPDDDEAPAEQPSL